MDADVFTAQAAHSSDLAEAARTAGADQERSPDAFVAVAAAFTATPLVAPLRHALAALGADQSIVLLPYGQVLEPLLDPSRGFASNARGLNVCLLRLRGDRALSHGETADPMELSAAVISAVRAYSEGGFAPLAICLCPSAPGERDDRARAAEAAIAAELAGLPAVTVCRVSDWFETYAVAAPFDLDGDALADLPYTEEAFAALALCLARIAGSLAVKPKKVIAVDCDFTLWEGACGDLPPAELGLSPRFLAVQRFLRERAQAGFLLALATRNEPEAVERVFRERAGDLAITRADFVAAQMGWTPKSEHLEALARALGVGLDSFILVDDDPFVCAEVAARLPEVTVVHLPVEEDGATLLRQIPAFDHFFVTEEDRTRSDGYRADALRAMESRQVTSVADLNQRLGTSIVVAPAERRHWQRVEQLIARTNQFSSGTLSPAEVRTALQSGAPVFVVSVSDRFGDYGIVAAAILAREPAGYLLEGMAISCRVLGRGVDQALLDHLRGVVRDSGLGELRARCKDTGRNRLARQFLDERAYGVVRNGDASTYLIACADPLARPEPSAPRE